MAWGIPFPPGPYGEYEGPSDTWPNNGWWCRLHAYAHTQMSEAERAVFGDRSYWYCVVQKFVSNGNNAMPEGDRGVKLPPIQPHEPPTWFKFERGHKSPAVVISLPSQILAVSCDFKMIVEGLEPGVHQFFPIDIRNRNGPVYAVPYEVMVIGQSRDSFLPAQSLNSLARSSSDGSVWYYMSGSKVEVQGTTLDYEKHAGAHLWVERAFGSQLICMSDDLAMRVKRSGLKMPHHWQMQTV